MRNEFLPLQSSLFTPEEQREKTARKKELMEQVQLLTTNSNRLFTMGPPTPGLPVDLNQKMDALGNPLTTLQSSLINGMKGFKK